MPVPNSFANVTTSIPLSQLDANFNTPITLGNTAIQLGNTVTTLNNMTLANVTISSGNVTITNVSVTTANVTTANITTAIIGTANVTTANVTTGIIGTANVTTGNITTAIISTANVATANITTSQILNYGTANSVVYLNSSKAATANTGLQFDGTNLGLGVTPVTQFAGYRTLQIASQGLISSDTVSNGELEINNNAYRAPTTATLTYINSFAATKYAQYRGEHRWFTSTGVPSAGNAITFTQAMTLDANGNLLVGTTTTTNNLRLNESLAVVKAGSGQFPGVAVTGYVGTGNSTRPLFDFNRSRGTTDGSMTAVASGDFLGSVIFRGSDGTSFQDAALIQGEVDGTVGSAVMPGRITFYTSPAGSASVTERARITSGGYFKAQGNSTYSDSAANYHEFISAVTDSVVLYVRSNAASGNQYGAYIQTNNDQNDVTRYFLRCVGGATERATFRSNGGLANYSANNVNLASDQRLKKDVSPLATTWDKVKQIEVVNFRYKDCNEGDPLLYGVIAQQVQPILPELVVVTQEAKEATEDTEATPEYYGIREQPMYWLAIKALQEAMTRIEALEAKVAALENA